MTSPLERKLAKVLQALPSGKRDPQTIPVPEYDRAIFAMLHPGNPDEDRWLLGFIGSIDMQSESARMMMTKVRSQTRAEKEHAMAKWRERFLGLRTLDEQARDPDTQRAMEVIRKRA